jgi:opacity protein-like surface antigen
MHSRRLTFFGVAALVLASGVTHAADYPQPIYQPEPQPIIIQQPAPAAFDCCDGWYLRGQIGIGMNNADYDLTSTPIPVGGRFISRSVGDTFFGGIGIGYNWNSWLRLEGTVDYRARTRFAALGGIFNGGPLQLDQFEGYLKSWVFLANAFVDLGTWNCFTPFVGAGIGFAHHQMENWTDVTPAVLPPAAGSAFGVGRDTAKWSMAWALYGGVAYNVTKSFKIDFTYRYMDLGSAREVIECGGSCGDSFTLDFKNLHSHDFMVGFRWECCDLPTPPPPMVYTPPPPLRSKG